MAAAALWRSSELAFTMENVGGHVIGGGFLEPRSSMVAFIGNDWVGAMGVLQNEVTMFQSA